MTEKKNYSLLVASAFFIVFLFFVVAFDPEITTNAVLNLANVEDDYNFASDIYGNISLTIESSDFIYNTSEVRLELMYSDEVLYWSKMNITPFFSQTTPKLTSSDLVKSGNVYGYNKTGNYTIDLSKFGLSTKPYYGELELRLVIENKDDVIIKKSKDIEISNKSSDKVVIYKFTEVGQVEFEVDDDEMQITDTSSSFDDGDYIWCLVKFDKTTLKNQDGSLDIYFYSPDGLDKKFLDVTNNIANVSDDEEGGICDDNDKTVCGAFYEVDSKDYGEWECKAVANPGNITISSQDLFFEKPFVMGGTGPKLTKNIPDINISKNGSYSTLDMDDYFDGQGKMQFGVTNLKYLIATFDSSHKLLFANPNNFEGVENITVRASDGFNITESNKFLIKVGAGNFSPSVGCVPDWKTTSWSACVNGVQVRSVVDVKTCGVETGKPADSQSCVETPSDVTSGEKYKTTVTQGTAVKNPVNPIVWVLLGLGILSFIGVGVYYLINKKKEEVVENESPIQDNGNPITQTVQTQTVQNVDTGEVSAYIEKALEEKQEISAIKQSLLKAGWDAKLIDEKIPFAQARVYVKSKLAQGVDKEKLRDSFLLRGWTKEQVDKLF